MNKLQKEAHLKIYRPQEEIPKQAVAVLMYGNAHWWALILQSGGWRICDSDQREGPVSLHQEIKAHVCRKYKDNRTGMAWIVIPIEEHRRMLQQQRMILGNQIEPVQTRLNIESDVEMVDIQ